MNLPTCSGVRLCFFTFMTRLGVNLVTITFVLALSHFFLQVGNKVGPYRYWEYANAANSFSAANV